jgi:hypothetical protein
MRPIPFLAVALLAVTASCAHGPTAPGMPSSARAKAGAAAETATGMKPWAEVVKESRAIEGLFPLHLRRDATLLMELQADQLDRDFGMAMHISRGAGVFNLHDGLPLSDGEIMRFRRVGDRVYLVHVNPRFTALEGSPMRLSLDENVGHSIVAGFKVEAEDTVRRAVLVDLSGWVASDHAGIAELLKWYWGNKPVAFDKDRSFVSGAMGFPQNVEIDVELTYHPSDRPAGWAALEWAGVSDMRSIPVGVRYSIYALPETPMRARLADPRVGYFTTTLRDFSRDRDWDPHQRFVNRWRLEPGTCSEGRCEPLRPIVFYIDRTVPHEYRQAVREGIEGWNKAFDAAGWRNAVQAREAPEDSAWSAEDMRYSTVRWSAAHSMGYAIGPSQVDPRTGEILNADILISASFVNWWSQAYEEFVGPDALLERLRGHDPLHRHLPPHLSGRLCVAASGKAHELRLQHLALAAFGAIDGAGPLPEAYLHDAIRDLVLHEVGHTLGLRHNFRGSSAIPFERLHDRDFVRRHGLTLSVMDYAAVNIALDPAEQGYYANPEVGSYDVWAIRYGYTRPPGDDAGAERALVRAIAGESTHPLHAYNTDEDTHLGPMALDPRSNVWDLGADPLLWARHRAALVARVQPRLEDRLIGTGDGYARLRDAGSFLLFERMRSLLPAARVVGGIEFSRAHRGDPAAPAPFTPMSAERQREAVRLIAELGFAPGAFTLDGELLNRMPPARDGDWTGPWMVAPIDYPIHQRVAQLQQQLLRQLMHEGRLARIIDNGARMPRDAEAYTVAELFSTLTGAVWAELGPRSRTIDSFRRDLQMAHVDELTRMLARPAPAPAPPPNAFAWVAPTPVPGQARALARLELVELRGRIDRALAAPGLDRDTRAHLLEAHTRIGRALDAALTEPLR